MILITVQMTLQIISWNSNEDCTAHKQMSQCASSLLQDVHIAYRTLDSSV